MNKSSAPFHLVFTDVWGLTPILSSNGYKYFIIFVDHYTRFTWFYPLCLTSEVFDTFLIFQKHVECKFNAKILLEQSDSGGKFLSFNKHFEKL